MSLHHTPEQHDADPPEAWRVVKVWDRRWNLVSSLNEDAVFESFTTKREAAAAKADGWAVRQYAKEDRWFRGEPVAGWKPYAQIVAERERHAAWVAAGYPKRQRGEVSKP